MYRAHPILFAITLGCAAAPPDAPTPEGEGTEIGDEGGGWLCTEDSQPVVDPDARINALGASTTELLASTTGDFFGPGVRIMLVADPDQAVFFDAAPAEYGPAGEPEPECPDSLYVGVVADVQLDELDMVTPVAGLSFSEDGGVAFDAGSTIHEDYEVDPDDDEGGSDDDGSGSSGDGSVTSCSATPTTFDIDDMSHVQVVVRGTLTDGTWTAEALWRADSKPQGDDATVESYEEVFWTGTATAD